MVEKKYHTIVVGGGIAGLTCAAYLAKEGRRVLIIEKNRECGGLVNSFSRDGFQFEAGVRALENAGIIFPMLKELGIELDVVRSSVSVGVENDILHIKDLGSLTEYRNLLELSDKIIHKLPPRQKEIFLLRKEQGLTNDKIAEKLGITKKSVDNQLSIAVNKIKEFMLKGGILQILFIYLFID